MTKRWKIKIRYAHPNGNIETHHKEIDEMEELQDIIEGGPDYRLLVDIRFNYNLIPGIPEEQMAAQLSWSGERKSALIAVVAALLVE